MGKNKPLTSSVGRRDLLTETGRSYLEWSLGEVLGYLSGGDCMRAGHEAVIPVGVRRVRGGGGERMLRPLDRGYAGFRQQAFPETR